MKWDFQASRMFSLLSMQNCRPWSAGVKEERERGRSCSLVYRGFKEVVLKSDVVWNGALLTAELFQTFCDQVGLLVKQIFSEKGALK